MKVCIKCNKEFKTNQDLNRHLSKKISCDRILKCFKCDKILKTKFNLNRHMSICKVSLEDCFNELRNELDALKLKLLTNNNTQNTIINNTQNNTTNNTQNNIIINSFGNEDISHITKELLESKILKIINTSNSEIEKYNYEGIILNCRYNDIKLLDVHILLTKLIYFSKKENNTMKKESDKYYIKDDKWKEINFNELHLKVLNKHQNVLIELESSTLINDYRFIKILENYFGSDSNCNLQIQPTKIEFILPKRKYKLLSELLDYELYNM
jgi:hypothetical protein